MLSYVNIYLNFMIGNIIRVMVNKDFKKDKLEKQLMVYINKYFVNEQKWQIVSEIIKDTNSKVRSGFKFDFIANKLKSLLFYDFISFLKYDEFTGSFLFDYVSNDDCTVHKNYINNYLEKFDLQDLMSDDNSFLHNLDNRYKAFFVSDSKHHYGIVFLYNEDPTLIKDVDVFMLETICENISLAITNSLYYNNLKLSNFYKKIFIENMMSEFKIPLNLILGYSSLISAGANIEDKKKDVYIQHICKNSTYIHNLIENILSFSNLDDEFCLNYEFFDNKRVILQTISLFDELTLEKNINIKIFLLSLNIQADLKKFQQAIFNVLNNIVLISVPNSTITISTYVDGDNFNFELVHIKDNKNIEPFEIKNTDMSLNIGPNNKNVGINIAKRIIQKHRGNTYYKHKNNNEYIFKLEIPLKKETKYQEKLP